MQPSTPSTPGPDGVDPSASHSPLWMAADESVRRKRRRTTPTEVAEAAGHTPGSSPAVAVGVVVNSEGPPLVPDNLALSPVNAAEDRSGNSRYSLRAATNLGTPKYVFDNPFQSDVPKNKRKVLQLNPNGKLLDSPIKRGDTGLQEPSKDVKRRDRPRKRPGAKSERLSRLVIIRYGSETLPRRERLGQEIHEIMHGHTTYNLLKRRAEKVQGPQELSKPTHPFFLARQLANKAEDAGVRKDISTQEGANATADRQELPNPRPFPVTGRLKPISAPKPITKPKRLDDPIEPIWPPCGMIHIQDNEAHDNVECQQVSFESKKAKGLEAKVPEAESVLAAIARSIRGDCSRVKYSTDTPLRGRRRILKTGDEFHGIVVERFAWNPTKEPSENNSTPIKATHPAVTNLLSEIETSRSAFEKGCYDELPWVQKYAPDTALKVLQIGQETLVLRNWLQKLTVTAVNTTINKPDLQPSKASRMEVGKRKKRKRAKDLDDFIVSSGDEEVELDEVPREEDDEDELAGGVTVPKRTVVRRNGLLSADKASRESPPASNTILLSGPSGCGKTAAVYAVASELGFEVFEVNAGSRRSARDVVERVGDMAQNHLVQILNKTDGIAGAGAEEHDTPQGAEKQTSMGNFFKLKTIKGVPAEQKIAHPAYRDSEVQKPKPNQRQSLILLEEVDVLFSEDKQFWNGVLALISQSKRPIVMTCNDESLLPMDSLSLNAILRYRPPPPELAANYLSVLCANEGHIVDPKDILDLYVTTGKDLRATIMQLDYWCQMAVGSQKSGLDWIVDCPWSNRLGSSPDVPRIISLDTYIKGMGWLSRDMALEKNEGLEKRTRLVEDYFIQWDVSPVEWVESKVSPTCCRGGNTLEQLDQASFMSEMESVLDLLCPESNDYPTKVIVTLVFSNINVNKI